MQKIIKKIKKLLPFILIFGGYLLVAVVIFKHRLLNINTHYGMPDVDPDGTIWYFWARFVADKNNLNFNMNNLFSSYPYGYDLTPIPFFSIIYEINIRLINFLGFSWQNILLVINTSLVYTYAASALSAFLLTYYLTRSKYASMIAGFIFSFSFYHILMGRGYISQNHFEFIPLYFLSLFYHLDKKNIETLILSGLAFTIMFMANSYWAFYSLIFSFPILLFYKKDEVYEKIKSVFLYYLVVLGIGILININFFREQFFVFNPVLLKMSGKVFEPKNQVVDLLTFFVPSVNNFIYKDFGFGNNFLGYTSLALGLSGLFFIRRIKKYTLLLFCFLLSILLASYIPNLFFINEMYFKLFPAFRAVSRLNIFSSMFLSLMAGLSITYFLTRYKDYLSKSALIIWRLLFVVVCALILLEGLNSDITWERTTDFSKIAALYDPIKNNPDIKVIAGYPMNLSNGTNGTPPNYERLGQVIHGRSLVGGLDPFWLQGSDYFNSVKNIEKKETLDNLSKSGVDTIIVYKNLLNNSQKIIANLKADKRLNYIADYRADYDDSAYVSANDLARSFSVFQIKDVVTNNKNKIESNVVVRNLGEGSYKYNKDSGTKYRISLKNINNKIEVILDEPYSIKWKMYINKNNFLGDLPYLYEKDIYGNTHIRTDIYKNGWVVDPGYIIKNFDKSLYKQNPDGSVDIELTLYFRPQSYFYLGLIVSGTTLFLCAGYLIISVVRKYGRHSNQQD